MKVRPAKIILSLLFAVLIVFNLLLLYQNWNLQGQVRTLSVKLKTPPELSLLRLSSSYYPYCGPPPQPGEEQGPPPPLSMLVFVSRNDCAACLQEAEVWEKLYKKYSPKGFHVSLVVTKEDYLWAEDLADEYKLSFRVSPVDPTLLQVLGVPPITPFKVMVDSLHRVVYLSGANGEPEDRKSFGEVAEKLCQVYLPRPGNL